MFKIAVNGFVMRAIRYGQVRKDFVSKEIMCYDHQDPGNKRKITFMKMRNNRALGFPGFLGFYGVKGLIHGDWFQ